MRLTRLYTRAGDDGTTRLAHGVEVAKDSARVRAYGTVDELSSRLGVALAGGLCERLCDVVTELQNRLFDLGADLATPIDADVSFVVPRIDGAQVEKLERLIDELNEAVGPLENFILPGGAPGAAALHVARTVCRRAERELVTLAREENIGDHVIPYVNRLSDALFAMARYENHVRGVPEPQWRPAGD